MSTNPCGDRMTKDVAMKLASITYCEDIRGALHQYLPDWSAVWMPDAAVRGNYAFIARDRVSGQFAVAIRGSLLSFTWDAFDNWFEQDFNVYVQVDWQYPADPQNGPKISKGSSDGLDDLAALVQTTPGGQTTMLEYLLAEASGAGQSVAVVGHSLGGNLATVFAPWLLYQFGQQPQPAPPSFCVYTFAAPPAGNTAFAQAFDAAFPDSWRYYNTLDIVPMASVLISMLGMCELYQPAPVASDVEIYDGYTLCNGIEAIAVTIAGTEVWYDSFYSQTNLTSGSVPLNPDDTYCPLEPNLPPLFQWFEKAGCEHGHNTYLRLLGSTPLDCKQLSFTP